MVQRFADFFESTTWTEGTPATLVAQAEQQNSFVQRGNYWVITYGSESAHVSNSVGTRTLAHLIAAQDREVPVLRLWMRVHDTDETTATQFTSGRVPMVDKKAVSSIQSEAKRLQAELEEAKEIGDEARSAAARAQLEDLAESARSARGRLGQARPFVDEVERARQALQHARRRAIGAIRSQAPRLAAHLARSIRISRHCCYAPAQETNWLVEFSRNSS